MRYAKMIKQSKKRGVAWLLTLTLVLAAMAGNLTLPVSAQVHTGQAGDNVTWTLDTVTGEMEFTGTGPMWNWTWDNRPWDAHMESITSIVISDTITSIGSFAFSGASGLTSVDMLSATYIGAGAFAEASSLTSVDMPSVTHIGELAFYRAIRLTSVDMPSVTYIGWGAFSGTSLTSVYIPSVTHIGWGAFSGATSLTSVYMPSVTYIGHGAFWGLSLISVYMPSVIHIANSAFQHASSLMSVDIPASVTHIGIGAFAYASSLTEIRVALGNAYYRDIDGVLFNYAATLLHTYPAGRSAVHYAIPASVTHIGYAAFLYATNLTSIYMPSVTHIRMEAFAEATGLASVYMPSVTYIGEWAFWGATSLTSIYMPRATHIGESAFRGTSSLTNVYMPRVTYIGGGAFAVSEDYDDYWIASSSLTSVYMPSVTHIGDAAFAGATSLTSVDIPASVTYIGRGAFWGASSLTSVTIRSRDATFGQYIFGDTYYAIAHPDLTIFAFAGSTAEAYARDNGHNFVPLCDDCEEYPCICCDYCGYPCDCDDNGNGNGNGDLAQLTLVKCYRTETIAVTGTADFRGYAVAVEIGGRVRHTEPLFGGTIDISRLIPRNANRATRLAVVNAHAVPDMTVNTLERWSASDMLSTITTLNVRGARMDRNEVTIDYANERITGTGTYYFRASATGAWQSITFSDTDYICISGFIMGGRLEIRRASTADAAAGQVMRLSIRGRQRAPNVSVRGGVFRGVNNNMEFSIDNGATWTNVTTPMSAEGRAGAILFRVRATDRAMRSFPTAFVVAP